mgnify:CR=1 FL=1
MAEPSHLMYWNATWRAGETNQKRLNHHIWCIEILQKTDVLYVVRMAEPSHLMYWNISLTPNILLFVAAEPSHLMYWNSINGYVLSSFLLSWTITFDVLKSCLCTYCLPAADHAEPSHLMYWNSGQRTSPAPAERAEPSHLMYWNHFLLVHAVLGLIRWTITFDVLKSIRYLFS